MRAANGSGGIRKNLVVVRAGKNSLHAMWLQGPAERDWDLIVSVYDPDAHFEPRDDGPYRKPPDLSANPATLIALAGE